LADIFETRPYKMSESQIHPDKRHGLPEIVRAFKSFSARRINFLRKTPGIPVWQRNYYEHVIRDQPELNRIYLYIQDNPIKWAIHLENQKRSG
jgi:REP-associated tyrosine transposase